MTDRTAERAAFAGAKLSLAKVREARGEPGATADVARLEGIVGLIVANARRAASTDRAAQVRRPAAPAPRRPVDPLQAGIDAAARARHEAEQALVRCFGSREEVDGLVGRAVEARAAHGRLLLERDRRDRPHIHSRRAASR